MKWIGPLFTNAGWWFAYVLYSDDEWFIDKDNPIKIGAGKFGIMLLLIMEKSTERVRSTRSTYSKKG